MASCHCFPCVGLLQWNSWHHHDSWSFVCDLLFFSLEDCIMFCLSPRFWNFIIMCRVEGLFGGHCAGPLRDFCNLKTHALSSGKYSCRLFLDDFFWVFFSFWIIFINHRLNFLDRALIFLSSLLFPSICFFAIFLSFMGDFSQIYL